jgi:hypothetical protein
LLPNPTSSKFVNRSLALVQLGFRPNQKQQEEAESSLLPLGFSLLEEKQQKSETESKSASNRG